MEAPLRAFFVSIFAGGLALAAQAIGGFVQGRALLDKGDWKGAAVAFQRAPADPASQLGLGVALWGAGDRKGALEAFQRGVRAPSPDALLGALRLRPDYDDARLAFGLSLQQAGNAEGAMAQYRAVLRRNPRSAEAHNWLGVAFMQKNQLAEAAASLREAIRLKPGFARAHNNLGSTLAQSGDLEGGIRAFETGLRHAPDDLALRLNLGTALRDKGDADGAMKQFAFVIARNADNPEVHYQYGQALRQKGDMEGAVRSFETALDLNPEYRECYYILGQTLRQWAASRRRQALSPAAEEALKSGVEAGRSGNLRGAIDSLSRAVSLAPDAPEPRFHLGAALWYAGEKAKSAAQLDEAMRLNPAFAEAASLRGIAHRDAGELDAARRLMQRAVALNPKLPIGYFDLALVFLRAGRTAHALGQFEAGLNLPALPGAPPDLDVAIRELRPKVNDASGHLVLGRLLGLAGAPASAVIAEFESAIRLEPGNADAHNYLGLVYTQANEDPKAVAEFREAIRLRPDHADAHANLGAVLTATDAAEAVRELEKAVEVAPGLLKAHYNLAIAYGSSPKHGVDREIAQLRKLIEQEAAYPRAAFSLGKALLRKGVVAEAVTQLQKAVEMEPAHGEAHYQLGLALTRAGKASEAAAHLEKGRALIAASQRDQTALLDLEEGSAALSRGDVDHAVAKFRQLVKDRPAFAEAHYRLGLALARRGDAAARDSFRKTIELDPGHAGAREKIAPKGDDPMRMKELESYIRESKFQEVEPLLRAYLSERPESSWGWYALGYAMFAQRRIGDSISALAKSLSINVTNADAHKVLGRNLMIIGRFDDAQREFELGEKYDPRSAEIPFNLGRLHSIQDQWAQARRAFERALENDPAYMEALDGLGFALEALGDDAGATAHYEKAMKLNEERKASYATPYVNLSSLQLRNGDVESALRMAKAAVGVNAKADRAWFQLGRTLERRGELEQAAEALQRAIAINARSSSYFYSLATVYRRLGKQKESAEAMDTFSKLTKESNELEQKRLEFMRQERP